MVTIRCRVVIEGVERIFECFHGSDRFQAISGAGFRCNLANNP
jgi:hypothetical protein